MGIFKFKMNATIDEFSISLADEFIKAYSLGTDKSSKKNEKKLAKANNAISNKIDNFKKENKLGIYKKARIGNKFMWALREHGFENEFAEDITKKLFYKLNEK
jgi:hypothetical protein